MAKILVADDNSNVQKTVILALAELGVEVVAVNNGDAAVRKLPDVLPDLVLADIFMPVRNGYEVCEFVKKDPRFAHVPVVLLVGAFDPVDEREAQRVGADGILKKPFVPPDPLITMVKTLLDRSIGERLVAVEASKPAVSVQSKVGGGGVATAERRPPAVQIGEEFPPKEVLSRPPVDRLSFGEGGRPIAFGQLLDSPAKDSAASEVIEPVDDEQILTSSRDAALGDPIFWKTEEPEPETEEESSEAESQQSTDLPASVWKLGEETLQSQADADFLQPVEPFELVREEKDDQAGQASTIVESSPLLAQDAASQASLTVEPGKLEDLAANPIEWMASVPPPPAEEIPEAAPEWSAAVPEAADGDQTSILETDNLKAALAPLASESVSSLVAAPTDSASLAEPPLPLSPASPSADHALAQSDENEKYSFPVQTWEELAANLHNKPSELVAQPHASADADAQSVSTDFLPPVSLPPAPSLEDKAPSIPRHDWNDLAASLKPNRTEPVAEKIEHTAASIARPPALTDAIAQPASKDSVPPVSMAPAPNLEDTVHSIPKQDWTDLAASLPPDLREPVAEKAKPEPVPAAESLAAPHASGQPEAADTTSPVSKPLAQSPEDSARSIPKLDWKDLAASLQQKRIEPVAQKQEPARDSVSPVSAASAVDTRSTSTPVAPISAAPVVTAAPAAAAANALPTPSNAAAPGAPDPALVEAVVQRVLEKMRPQVVDIITKEFLRPVVQALVHREITKR